MYKKILIILTLFAIIIIMCYFAVSYGHKYNIDNKIFPKNGVVQLIIEPEYNQYFFNQEVFIKVSIVNNSQSNYYLKEPLHWYSFNFDIKDSKGEKLGSGVTLDIMPSTDSIVVYPDSTFSTIVNLSWFFNSLSLDDTEKNETYSINGVYQGLNSNHIMIEFIPPTGIDLILYNSTSKCFKASMFPHKNNEIESLVTLLTEFPDSRYTPQLYNILLLSASSISDSNRFFSILDIYLNNNRNDYSIYDAFVLFKNFIQKQLDWSDNKIQLEINNIQRNYTGEKFQSVIKMFEENFDYETKLNRKLGWQR